MHDVYNLETNFPVLPQSAFSLTVLYERSETSFLQLGILGSGRGLQNKAPAVVPFSPEKKQHPVLIPKPPGQAGALSRGGYTLCKVLNWDPKQLTNVQNYARERIKHHIQKGQLISGRSITKQPPDIILTIQAEIAMEFPFLLRYQDNWPTRDIMTRYLSKA